MFNFFKTLKSGKSSEENSPLLSKETTNDFLENMPKDNLKKVEIVEIYDGVNLFISDSTQKEHIIDHIKALQDTLSLDNGFKPDFELKELEDGRIAIYGNLKTALIILRHSGYISKEKTENLVHTVNEKLQEEKFIKYHQVLHRYEQNYKLAEKRCIFNEESCAQIFLKRQIIN